MMIHDPRTVVQRLARELAAQILLNYAPDEMAECTGALVPLYQARSVIELPSDVGQVIDLIEADITLRDHYSCTGCNAKFFDTEDMVNDACPVCASPVKGENARAA